MSIQRRTTSTTGILGLVMTAAALAGCGEDTPERTIAVITGLEKDTFSQEPKVVSLHIEATSASGTKYTADSTPGGSFDFGEVLADEPIAVDVTGTDASGEVVVAGRSLSGLVPGAFASSEIPVFVQRLGAWARPPGELVRAHVDAQAGVLGERYLATTGGTWAGDAKGEADARFGDFYDMVSFAPAVTPVLPKNAKSLLVRFNALLVISDDEAFWADTSTGAYYEVPLPSGLASFADVAGGRVVEASTGTGYIVGATRPSGPTKAVLAVNSDGTIEALTLNEARQGAAAAWSPGIGLLVAGGSATGAGYEVLPSGKTKFLPRDAPADPTEGAGAAATEAGVMTLVGGHVMGMPAPTRTLAPGCGTDCAPKEVADLALPAALDRVQAFNMTGGRLIAVGQEVGGDKLTRSFVVDLGAKKATEIPLKEPRTGATALPAPNGTLALLGGRHVDGTPALHLEMFFPPTSTP
ncbi:hypothetical protein [Polyangium aurulentum]|uniref:hypothetical protein n=1 Tax=Polyangium aurulentum TaxID=2567896 RepID=UPI001F41F48C|nr:hypothetical protein [Polyangium aurulentum]